MPVYRSHQLRASQGPKPKQAGIQKTLHPLHQKYPHLVPKENLQLIQNFQRREKQYSLQQRVLDRSQEKSFSGISNSIYGANNTGVYSSPVRYDRLASLNKSKKKMNIPDSHRPSDARYPIRSPRAENPGSKGLAISREPSLEPAGDGCLLRRSFDKGQSPWSVGSKVGGLRGAQGSGAVRRRAAGGNPKRMAPAGKQQQVQAQYQLSKNGSALKELSKDRDQYSAQKRKSNQSSLDKYSGGPNAKDRRQRAPYDMYHRQNSQKTDNNNFVNNVQYESDGEGFGDKQVALKQNQTSPSLRTANRKSKNRQNSQSPKGFYGTIQNQQHQVSNRISNYRVLNGRYSGSNQNASGQQNAAARSSFQRLKQSAMVPGNYDFRTVDFFAKYESQHFIQRNEGSLADKKQTLLLAQIFHGKQAVPQSKNDLILAKRESRALRIAKKTHIKKGQFLDAFCNEAVERTELQLVKQMVDWALLTVSRNDEPRGAEVRLQNKQHSVPFHSKNSSTIFKEVEGAETKSGERWNQSHMRIGSLRSLHCEQEAAAATTEQQAEDIRFRQSELKMLNAEQNQNVLKHEIASENEINMFATEKVMAGYYEVSDSVDNSMKNSFAQNRKTPATTDAKVSQLSRTKSANQTQASGAAHNNRQGMKAEMYRAAMASADNFAAQYKKNEPDSNYNNHAASKAQPNNVQGYNGRGLSAVAGSIRKKEHSATAANHFGNITRSPPRTQGRKYGRNARYQQVGQYRTNQQPQLRKKFMTRFQALQMKNQQEPLSYTNADLMYIEQQIKQQVQYLKHQQTQTINLKTSQDGPQGEELISVNQANEIGKQKSSYNILQKGSSRPRRDRSKDGSNQYMSTSKYNDPIIGSLEPRDHGRDRHEGFETNSKRQHEIKIEGASDTYNRSGSSASKNNSYLIVRQPNPLVKTRTNELKVPRSTIGPNQRRINASPNQFQNYRVGQGIEQQTIQLTNQNSLLDSKNKDRREAVGLSSHLYTQKGPILTQAAYNRREALQKCRNAGNSNLAKLKRSKPYMDSKQAAMQIKEERSQLSKFDATSLGLSNFNQPNQPDFISNFDVNEHSEQNQMSILAISQANHVPSMKESNHSQKLKRGGQRSGHPSSTHKSPLNNNERPQVNAAAHSTKKFQPSAGMLQSNQKAVSSYSLSSKHSGYSSMTPLRDQQLLQARFVAGKPSKRNNGNKAAGSQKQRTQGKRDTRKLDFDFGNDDQIATSIAIFDRKAKPKRCWTLKQETQADKVIEEGSDDGDNSFASDTPAQAHHRKRAENKVIDGFSQAQLNFEYTYEKMNKRETDEDEDHKRRHTEKTTFSPNEDRIDELEKGSFATRKTNNDQMNYMMNSMSNKQMKNDSSVFASKNSLRLARPSQYIENSHDQANALPFTSNPALLAADRPSVHQEQNSGSHLDLLPIRVSHSLENKQAETMEHSSAVGDALVHDQQQFESQPNLPAHRRGAQQPSENIATTLPLVNQASQQDLDGSGGVVGAGKGGEASKVKRLRQMVINTRTSPSYPLPPTEATYSHSYLPSHQSRRPVHQNQIQGALLHPSNTVKPGTSHKKAGGMPFNGTAYLATTNARDQALWGSHRASLAKQSAAMLVNRASHYQTNMNKANQHKFRQIARPYLMSSSQGGAKSRHLINGLIQHTVTYCPKNFLSPAKHGPTPSFPAPEALTNQKHPVGLPDLSVLQSQNAIGDGRVRVHEVGDGVTPKARDERVFVNEVQFSPSRAAAALKSVDKSDELFGDRELAEAAQHQKITLTEETAKAKTKPMLHPLLNNQRTEISKVNLNRSFGTILASSEATGSGPVGACEAVSAGTVSKNPQHRGSTIIHQKLQNNYSRPKSNNTSHRRADRMNQIGMSKSLLNNTGALINPKSFNPPTLKTNFTMDSNMKQKKLNSLQGAMLDEIGPQILTTLSQQNYGPANDSNTIGNPYGQGHIVINNMGKQDRKHNDKLLAYQSSRAQQFSVNVKKLSQKKMHAKSYISNQKYSSNAWYNGQF